MSFVKKEIGYIRDSFSQILRAIFIFVLFSSGLICALLLRLVGTNGTFISFISITIEIIMLIISYFLLNNFIETTEKTEGVKGKTK
ncbi:MAG: hypothetical protein EU532_13175 [Promethearchaeota archaeon]|nr:MAG: hypothetical protein EU532_13175 [Candidatus Lokiarchaeota archaeon]